MAGYQSDITFCGRRQAQQSLVVNSGVGRAPGGSGTCQRCRSGHNSVVVLGRRPPRGGRQREEHFMAEYLILIYGEEAAFAEPGPETMNQMMKGHQVFGERNAAALRGGNALQPTATATSVRPDASGGSSLPMARSARRKRLSVATTWWKRPTWTRPSIWQNRSPCRSAGLRSGQSGPSTERQPSTGGRISRSRGR